MYYRKIFLLLRDEHKTYENFLMKPSRQAEQKLAASKGVNP